jgi:hypothetical protein
MDNSSKQKTDESYCFLSVSGSLKIKHPAL